MFLFPLSSLVMLFVYMALLDSAFNKLSDGYLIGVALDVPLAVATLSALFIRNTPLAMFMTLVSVVAVAEWMNLSQPYRLHAPIIQLFLCLVLSRVVSRGRRHSVSDTIKDGAWLYKRLNIEQINWNWTARANQFTDKSARTFDLITVAVFVIGLLSSLGFAMTVYTTLWLLYFTLCQSLVLFVERASRLFCSWKSSGGINRVQDSARDGLAYSQEQIINGRQKVGEWFKSGFDQE